MGRLKRNNNHKLSVIVPFFNEPNIKENLRVIGETLSRSFSNYEVIGVEDGQIGSNSLRNTKNRSGKVKIISYPMNIGKGFAFLYGFSQSSGDIVALLDGDLDIHPKHLRLFADLMDLVDADIVIGSKRHPLSQITYPLVRRIYSSILQIIVRLFFGLNVTDTQVGVKLFKRKVLERVIPRMVVKTFAFDLEILVIAYRLGFRRIIEAPVELKINLGSKVNFGIARSFLVETLAIFYRRYLLRYYDRKISPANRQTLKLPSPKT